MPNATIERAQQCARFYRTLGYNALPGRSDVKGPALASYDAYWDVDLPEEVHNAWTATNIHLMTGVRWTLAVVDCDGEDAHDQFLRCKERNGTDGPFPTWVVQSGGGGWHYYFTLPPWLPDCPSRLLWGLWDPWGGNKHQGGWVKHREIRLLADRATVIAPPSIHVETGRTYEFLAGHGPRNFPRPMETPGWLLKLPSLRPPTTVPEKPPWRPLAPMAPGGPPGRRYDRKVVLTSIPDKAALAASWGLRIARPQPNPRGWMSCHSVFREDEHPSASFRPETGVYTEEQGAVVLSLFDLAAVLGAYPDWMTAVDDLGQRLLGAPVNGTAYVPRNGRHE